MTADKDYVLLPGPCVWLVAPVSAVQPTRGTEARRPSSPVSSQPTFLELCIWWSTGPPVLLRDVWSLPIAHYTQNRELSHVKGSHAQGNFGCGQHSLQPHKAEAALQGAQATKDRLLRPNKCLFFLNEKDFAILSSEYVALIDIYWALHDPSLSSLAWLIGIIERRPALAGWDSPLLGWSSPARPALLLCSLAPVRLN